jgi:hypothetical protein
VLYLSLHTLKHYGERLIWLADLRGLTGCWEAGDWERLMVRAGVLGQEKAVACILFLLADLLDYRPPLEARIPRAKTSLNRLEMGILKKRSAGRPLPQWSPLMLLSGGKALPTRLALAFESLFPRPEVLRQVFAGSRQSGVGPYYWKRVLQIVGAMRWRHDKHQIGNM